MTTSLNHLYEQDFLAWTEHTANLLKECRWDEIDLERLIEEVQSMGDRHKDALESNLIILLMHLLKWHYQPAYRSNSWRCSIVEHRRRIIHALKKHPSLKSHLPRVWDECYLDAREDASQETGLPINTFPNTCPWIAQKVLKTDFFPSDI